MIQVRFLEGTADLDMMQPPVVAFSFCLALGARADIMPIDGRSDAEKAADARRRSPEERKRMLDGSDKHDREIIVNETEALAVLEVEAQAAERAERSRRDKIVGAGVAMILLGAAAARGHFQRSKPRS